MAAGAEAVVAIQLIDACIGITKTILDIGRAVKDAQGLPPRLQDLCEKLPAIEDLLESARDRCDDGNVAEETTKTARPILEQCEQALGELREIFRKACPKEAEGRAKRVWRGSKSIFFGRDSKVQKLLVVVQESLKLLEQKEIFVIGDKLDELQQLTEALAQDEDGNISHTGAGNIFANHGGTHTNFVMSGSGRQINNPQTYNEGPSMDPIARARRWLAPLDPYLNLRKALKLRSANTGKWYLQSAQYTAWKDGRTTSTWLYGSAGSGKTVLTAGIIENLQHHCEKESNSSLAFFFFDFNDKEKQQPINMLKSILTQLLNRCTSVPETVQDLQATCDRDGREPSEHELLLALEHTLELLPNTFIVLDALDEGDPWSAVTELVVGMLNWGSKTLRVLVTSRKEPELEEALEEVVPLDMRIALQSDLVDNDISTYIRERLANDKSFKRWQKDPEIKVEIEETLRRGALGMFRWAACQLDALTQCLTRGKVRSTLRDLPKTLDETYERILRAIDEGENAEYAFKILVWLTFAERPLTLAEILEVTGIMVGQEPRFDRGEVLSDPNDVLRICSGLVSTDTICWFSDDGSGDEFETDDSGVHREQPSNSVGNDDGDGTTSLAGYNEPRDNSLGDNDATTYSTEHGDTRSSCDRRDYEADQMADDEDTSQISCSLERRNSVESFFSSDTDDPGLRREVLWSQAYSYFSARLRSAPHLRLAHFSVKEYFLSGRSGIGKYRLQLEETHEILARYCLVYLLRFRKDQWPIPRFPHRNTIFPMARYAADYWTQHARASGAPSQQQQTLSMDLFTCSPAFLTWVRRRMESISPEYTFDVSTLPEKTLSPLFMASLEGLAHVVSAIVAGECRGTHRDCSGKAVQTSLGPEHREVHQMPMSEEVDVNVRRRHYGSALWVASIQGHEEIVQLLIDAGADVDVEIAGGNALNVAVRQGITQLVHMLIRAGADVDAEGLLGTALLAASEEGFAEVARILVDAGADVSRAACYHPSNTPLKVASSRGHHEVVQVLLDAGADPSDLRPEGWASDGDSTIGD